MQHDYDRKRPRTLLGNEGPNMNRVVLFHPRGLGGRKLGVVLAQIIIVELQIDPRPELNPRGSLQNRLSLSLVEYNRKQDGRYNFCCSVHGFLPSPLVRERF